MRNPRMSRWSVVLMLVAFALFSGMTSGGMVAAEAGASYTVQLSGDSEVPPRATPAGGEVAMQISPDGQSLTYTVTVHDITNMTMGHIHIGAAGTNGDIVLPLVPPAPPGGGPTTGVIGQGTLTAAQLIGPLQGQPLSSLIAQMDAGTAYVNVHTASGASPAKLVAGDLPPGEIRGQIVRATTPAAMPGGLAVYRWGIRRATARSSLVGSRRAPRHPRSRGLPAKASARVIASGSRWHRSSLLSLLGYYVGLTAPRRCGGDPPLQGRGGLAPANPTRMREMQH